MIRSAAVDPNAFYKKVRSSEPKAYNQGNNETMSGALLCYALCPKGLSWCDTLQACSTDDPTLCPSGATYDEELGTCKGFKMEDLCQNCKNDCCQPYVWDNHDNQCYTAEQAEAAKLARKENNGNNGNGNGNGNGNSFTRNVEPMSKRASAVTDEWHQITCNQKSDFKALRFGDWLTNTGCYSNNLLSMSSFYFTPPSKATFCTLYMQAEWMLRDGSDWLYAGFNDINGPRAATTAFNHYRYNPYDPKAPELDTSDTSMFYNSLIYSANASFFAPDAYVEAAYGVSGRNWCIRSINFIIEAGGTVEAYLSITTGPTLSRQGAVVSAFWVTCTESPLTAR